MDWSHQTLTLSCDEEVRRAVEIVAAALNVEEKHHDDWGISFHAGDPAGESIGIMSTARLHTALGPLSDSQRAGVEATIPREPTVVVVGPTDRADAIVAALRAAGLHLIEREPYPSAWAQEADAAWRRLLPELRAQGWEIEVLGYAAPVQLEGRVPSALASTTDAGGTPAHSGLGARIRFPTLSGKAGRPSKANTRPATCHPTTRSAFFLRFMGAGGAKVTSDSAEQRSAGSAERGAAGRSAQRFRKP